MQLPVSIRRRTWEVLEAGSEGDDLSRAIDLIVMALVAGNVVAVTLESVASLGHAYHDLFAGFEKISIVAFSAEFLLRTWSSADSTRCEGSAARKRLRYLCSPMAIVDLIAIVPFYLSALFVLDLRFLRILRLLRMVKLTRYSAALHRLADVYHLQRTALGASFILMAMAIVFSASLIFIVEHSAQPVAFSSIPAAMWWAVCTLTTVGYGDVTPITPIGKTLTAFVQLFGIAMVALPTSLFASGFAHIMAKNESLLKDEAREALADGIITPDEANAFAHLAEDLSVEPEIAQEIIETLQRRQTLEDPPDCPHCGKSLAG